MNSIIKLELPENCRMLVVSDIHTQWQLLDGLLRKAEYDPQMDYLVIAGDIVEHGSDNIRTLEYVKSLCDKSDKAVCLLGNNDTMCARMAYTYGFERFQQQFYRNEHNTFRQMANTLGYTDCWEGNWLEIREKTVEKYGELLSFVRDLPICLETEDYVFVHAGLENRPDWRNTDDSYAITAKWFFREENPTGKWLIVGHFPTYNYKECKSTNLPIVDETKKMIGIDGGLGIKSACHMNLFVIEKQGKNYSHSVIWDTYKEKRIIKEDFSCELKPLYVDWGNQDIEILSEKDGFCKLRDNVSGAEGYLPKCEVYDFDGVKRVFRFLSSFPTVKKGERVSVFKEDGDFSLVITENAVVGWLPKKIIE